MTASEGERRGFFAYYREYAKSGLHAASAAALTALIGIASFTGNRWFVLVAIAAYVLPPVFLYFTGEGDRVPSVVGEDADKSDGEHGSKRDEDVRSGHDTGTDGVESDAATNREADPDEHGHETRVESGSDDTGSMAGERDRSQDRDTGPTATGSEDESGTAATNATSNQEPEEKQDDEDEGKEEDEEEPDVEPGWTAVDTPTEESLLDVVGTPNGAYAVGESGIVLARSGGDWEVAVEGGPTANANPLRGVDATADGGAAWFAGDSGVLGRYAEGKLTDHSAPEDQTSTWTDVAVTGAAGEERIHLVNGSGELLRGRYDGERVSWDEIEKPGSGSSISSVAFADDERGHLCDTNQGVYETADGGEGYERIGIDDANAAFTGVAASGSTVVVSCDDGSVFRYDGAVWTRLRAAETTLSAVDLADDTGLAVGDAGTIVERVDGDWESVEAPVDADLSGVAVGDATGTDVAVGTDGTVVER